MTEDHNLRAVPEQRVHGRSKTPDLTIRPTLDCPHTIFGEAKFGTGSAAKQAAAKQARQWTKDQPQNAPKRLAFALCYPDEIRGDLTPPEIAAYLRQTQGLEWMFAGAGGEAWRQGGIATLATEIRNVSGRRGDIETLLTGIIVESANLWISDRKAVNTSLAEALNMQPTKAGDDRILRIAAVMLANGCLLDRRLEAIWQDSPTALPKPALNETTKSLLTRRWRQILVVDYKPIFEPALACLMSLPDGPETERVLETLRGAAESCADALGALEYDVAGPIYHRLLESARYDGSFYTTPPAAMLLARLALSHVNCDWSDTEAIARLRIIDPACGTGTLLLAAQHAVRDLHSATTNERTSIEIVHLEMVQRVLHGLDINRHAVQLAACNLTLSSPRVDYQRMPLYTAKHGVLNEDGRERAWAGSIELLLQDSPGQLALDLGGPKAEEEIETGHGEGEQFGKDISEPFDLVIMNPPFTRNDIRNRQLTPAARKQVQQREQDIAERLKAQDEDAAQTIDQTSARTFFTPLADKILKPGERTLATVLPTTAMTAPSGEVERKLLATRFHIETVITAHDPKRIYFSGNTSIHESMVVATAAKDELKPTRFIQLHRNPTNKAEALALESCLRDSGNLAEWGREVMWPAARMKRGDWIPALFYNAELIEAVDEIQALMGARLSKLGDMAHVGPEGRRIRDAFPNDESMTGGYALLWRHDTERQQSIETTPDRRMRPREGKERYAERRLRPKAGRLLVGNKLWLSLARTTAVWAKEPMLGSAWCPVTVMGGEDERIEKAWAAWLNSTPGILGLLARRTKKLTYPAFPLENLRALPCPNPKTVDLQPLIDAFEATRSATLEALPNMADDPARIEIDAAAARVARLDGLQVAKWRAAISREPSVCNKVD
ncbi:MAG: N-6 DNA methylase [Chloroflexi bacterium]|nr:N-6 DNA methylase [Chloroflexota bacterium]